MAEIKPGCEYPGTVVKGDDRTQRGMYMVHIPELMPHLSEDTGWSVKNQCHNWRLHESESGIAGQYFPIHSGTKVIVKFFQEDESTGYIDRIISDGEEKSDLSPPLFDKSKSSLTDRDEQYVLLATPKYKTVIYVNEDSSENSNTLYIIHNNKKSILKINDEGVNIFSEENLTVEATSNVFITGNSSVNVFGSSNVNIDGSKINLNCGNFSGGKSVDKS